MIPLRSSMRTLVRFTALVVIGGAVYWSQAPGAGSAAEPADPPAGALPISLAGKLVLVRAVAGSNVLMAVNSDGSGPVTLAVPGTRPHVSPDGRKVAYTTLADGIAVLDLATGRESLLATPLSVSPKWSPDGRRILFWSDRSGSKELWTMNADGSEATQLSKGGGYHEADWSPDGSRIVARRGTGDGGDLWTLSADGTGAALLHAGEGMDSDPRWSPDGRRIAFVGTVVRRHAAGFTSAIFVVDADGSHLVRLTHGDYEEWAPAWAPDGMRIAFFGFPGGPDDPDIFTVRPDGTDLRVLVGGPTYDHGPAYGPAP
jgi:Tol biopolymer transport system component